jgi:hypothetical protein
MQRWRFRINHGENRGGALHRIADLPPGDRVQLIERPSDRAGIGFEQRAIAAADRMLAEKVGAKAAGATALTRRPIGATSCARLCDKPSIADLAAARSPDDAIGARPAIEVMLTIWPEPC